MNTPDVQQRIETAVALHRRGALAEAVALYRELLEQNPQLPEVNHNFGRILNQRGQCEQALVYFQRALAAAPQVGLYWLSFVEGLLAVDRPREAREILEDVMARGLDMPEARQLLARIPPEAADTRRTLPLPTRDEGVAPVATPDAWTLSIADGVRLCVPADLRSLTTYVLLEQEDWFEPELAFLRQFVTPGMRVLEIGANYGVYALSLAKRLAGRGRIIACEAAEWPATLLARGIQANACEEIVTLRKVACAERAGEVAVPLMFDRALHQHSVAAAADGDHPMETVRVITLDELLADPAWPQDGSVDLLKLDADGEEQQVLRGGARFFACQDPLICFDCRRHGNLDTALCDALRAQGFDLYRLVPGLNALIAIRTQGCHTLDAYQTKLFACKPTRAAQLRADGWLIDEHDTTPPPPVRTWGETLAAYPYTAAPIGEVTLLRAWQMLDRTADSDWLAYESALNAWLSANDPRQPLARRWQWLKQSRKQLIDARIKGDHRLATMLLSIRVFVACGEREMALQVNKILATALERGLMVGFDRPFVPPTARYDDSPPVEGVLSQWVQAAILESLEQLEFFSSRFHLDPQRLRKLDNNLNRTPEIERRRVLCQAVAQQDAAEVFHPAHLSDREDHFSAWRALSGRAPPPGAAPRQRSPAHVEPDWRQPPLPDHSHALFAQANAAPSAAERAALLLKCLGTNRDFVPAYVQYAELMLARHDKKTALIARSEATRLDGVPRDHREINQQECDCEEYREYRQRSGQAPLAKAATPWRILVVTNLLPPQELGGFGRTVWEFCRLLLQRGHTLKILTGDMPHLYRDPGEDVRVVEQQVSRCLRLYGDWRDGEMVFDPYRKLCEEKIAHNHARILAAVSDFRPDVCLFGNLDLLGYRFISAILAQGIPIVHRLGNGFPGYPPHAVPKSELYCLAGASEWLNRDLEKKGFIYRRTSVVYPGSALEGFYRYFLPEFDRLRICFAGLLMPYKGAHVLSSALAVLQEWGIPFTCEFAGDTTDPTFVAQIKTFAEEHRFSDKIRFTGFLNRSELAALYARSNVMVFPSLFEEPFGKSQVEAMSSGIIVLSSATGGAAEIIEDEISGLRFDPKDAHDLARKLLRLSRETEFAKALARRARERAFVFTTQRSIEKLESLYAELLRNKKNR